MVSGSTEGPGQRASPSVQGREQFHFLPLLSETPVASRWNIG